MSNSIILSEFPLVYYIYLFFISIHYSQFIFLFFVFLGSLDFQCFVIAFVSVFFSFLVILVSVLYICACYICYICYFCATYQNILWLFIYRYIYVTQFIKTFFDCWLVWVEASCCLTSILLLFKKEYYISIRYKDVKKLFLY